MNFVERPARGVRRHGDAFLQIAEAAEQLRRAARRCELRELRADCRHLDRLIEEGVDEAMQGQLMQHGRKRAAGGDPFAARVAAGGEDPEQRRTEHGRFVHAGDGAAEVERTHQGGSDAGRPVGEAEAGAGEAVTCRGRQRVHPRGELIAEPWVGELGVVGVDNKRGNGVAHRGVLEQAQLDAERVRRLAHEGLQLRGYGRLGVGAAHRAARGDGVEHRIVDRVGARRRQQRDAGDHIRDRRQRLRHQRAGEAEGAQGGEQGLGRRSARHRHLAIVRIDHAQGPDRVGDDIDVRVAQ